MVQQVAGSDMQAFVTKWECSAAVNRWRIGGTISHLTKYVTMIYCHGSKHENYKQNCLHALTCTVIKTDKRYEEIILLFLNLEHTSPTHLLKRDHLKIRGEHSQHRLSLTHILCLQNWNTCIKNLQKYMWWITLNTEKIRRQMRTCLSHPLLVSEYLLSK